MSTRPSRIALRAAGALVLGALLAVVLFYGARAYARARIEQALGPHAEIEQLSLGLSQIALRGVRIGKPEGSWPLQQQLRIESVVADISLRELWSAPRVVPKITLDGLYLAVVRSREGATRVLPDLTETPSDPKQPADSADQEPATALRIEELALRNATIELLDDSTKRRARIKLSHLQGSVRALQLPQLLQRSAVQLDAVVPGPLTTGKVKVRGWLVLASQDTDLSMQLRGLDLKVFEPFLITAMSAGVERGSFDLTLSPRIADRNVRARGHLDVHHLKLTEGEGASESFLSMPRAAAIKALEGRDGTISTDFKLQGDLDDPKFSLQEGLVAQIGVGIAAALGVSVIGVAAGVGKLGVEGVKAVGDAVTKDEK